MEKLEADATLMANANAKQGVAEMRILFGLLKAYKVIDKVRIIQLSLVVCYL